MFLCKISRFTFFLRIFEPKISSLWLTNDISAENTYKREKNGLLLAARQTKCENLLLLTDHESREIEEDGHKMKIQPVYEWSLELGV